MVVEEPSVDPIQLRVPSYSLERAAGIIEGKKQSLQQYATQVTQMHHKPTMPTKGVDYQTSVVKTPVDYGYESKVKRMLLECGELKRQLQSSKSSDTHFLF